MLLSIVSTNKILTGHTNRVASLVFLSDGSLASGLNEGTIRILNVTTDFTIKTLIGHTDTVTSLALFADGSLASGSFKEIRIWNLNSGLTFKTLTGPNNLVQSLACGSTDVTVRILNVNNCV